MMLKVTYISVNEYCDAHYPVITNDIESTNDSMKK